ncbi:MAG: hypothetical protein U5K84_12890 [Alkalibacterium sp.]|nr:hypothetical protein [Alkalibacterium sp.]
MDFGAKYILTQLVDKRPDLDAQKVLAPLDERVAGIDESLPEQRLISRLSVLE